MQIEVKP